MSFFVTTGKMKKAASKVSYPKNGPFPMRPKNWGEIDELTRSSVIVSKARVTFFTSDANIDVVDNALPNHRHVA